jgi:hypothetical protein
MQVVAPRAQPTLQFDVVSPDQRPHRMTVFTGMVDVEPPDIGRRFRVVSSDPNGVPIGFYVAEPQALPIAGSVLVAEAWIARMPISTGAERTIRYGVVNPVGSLVPAEGHPSLGWPQLQCLLFGGDLAVTLSYRLTVHTPL